MDMSNGEKEAKMETTKTSRRDAGIAAHRAAVAAQEAAYRAKVEAAEATPAPHDWTNIGTN